MDSLIALPVLYMLKSYKLHVENLASTQQNFRIFFICLLKNFRMWLKQNLSLSYEVNILHQIIAHKWPESNVMLISQLFKPNWVSANTKFVWNDLKKIQNPRVKIHLFYGALNFPAGYFGDKNCIVSNFECLKYCRASKNNNEKETRDFFTLAHWTISLEGKNMETLIKVMTGSTVVIPVHEHAESRIGLSGNVEKHTFTYIFRIENLK